MFCTIELSKLNFILLKVSIEIWFINSHIKISKRFKENITAKL